jgi:TPR repeat protein
MRANHAGGPGVPRTLGLALGAVLLGLALGACGGEEAAAPPAEPAAPAAEPAAPTHAGEERPELGPTSPEAGPVKTGTPRDPSDPELQFEQGVAHLLGRDGAAKNEVEAARWFRKAAEQGHARAQTQLAMAYQLGRGVPRDQAQSLAWMEKAAAQNQPKAQFELGVAHRDGRGVTKDPVRAGMWFVLASQSGGMASKLIGSSHLRTLSQAQRKEAFYLAQMWRVEHGLPRIGSPEAISPAQTGGAGDAAAADQAGSESTAPAPGEPEGAAAAKTEGGAAAGEASGAGDAQRGAAAGG